MRKSVSLAVLSLAMLPVFGFEATADTGTSGLTHDQGLLLLEQGHAHETLGQRDDALMDYTKVIESRVLSREEQARALFDRGLLLDGMNQLNDALGDYSASLALVPKFAPALNNRGNIYRRLDHLTEARRDYLASLAAGNGQTQYPNFGLGWIAEAQGNMPEARMFYAMALAADPSYVLASERLAALGSDSGTIHLHPPVATKAPMPDTAPTADSPIILHPPGFVPVPQTSIHLHPPSGETPAIRAAVFGREAMPALKPALDQETGHGPQIQLGAWRSEAEAAEGWNRAQRQAGDALQGFSPHIVAVDLPGAGRYYRLRINADKTGSKALCAVLQAKGLACFPTRD